MVASLQSFSALSQKMFHHFLLDPISHHVGNDARECFRHCQWISLGVYQILLHIECTRKIPEDISWHVNLREVDESLGAPNKIIADEVMANLKYNINIFTAAI